MIPFFTSSDWPRQVAVELNPLLNKSTSIGYAVGGAVTQITTKATGVTLNAFSGRITMVNANLAAATSVSFTLTNAEIELNDNILVSIASGATAGSYFVGVQAIAAGSCSIHVRNISAGALAEAIVLGFSIIKGAVA